VNIVFWSSSIYGFWLFLWYRQSLLSALDWLMTELSLLIIYINILSY
jgi:hypothetical protein